MRWYRLNRIINNKQMKYILTIIAIIVITVICFSLQPKSNLTNTEIAKLDDLKRQQKMYLLVTENSGFSEEGLQEYNNLVAEINKLTTK